VTLPTKGEAFDLGRVALWAAMVPAGYLLGWLSSVAFVSVLSVWALVESAWAAYRAGDEKALRRIEGKLDALLSAQSEEGSIR
jgi:hypothetical protein